MIILILSPKEELVRETNAYARAFHRKGFCIIGVETGFPLNGDLSQLLQLCPEQPSLVLHPESATPYLPWGLSQVGIPTVSFQIDAYTYTRRRIAWSMLFDHMLVFHPGYDAEFRKAAHPGAHLLPHAVDTEYFAKKELSAHLRSRMGGAGSGTDLSQARDDPPDAFRILSHERLCATLFA